MDRIGLIGIRWRPGGSEDLARYTIPADERRQRLPELRERIGAREIVYLATCNRVEVVFVNQPDTPLVAYRPRVFEALTGRKPTPGEAERTFNVWAGEGAAEHLFLVASGLDSSMVGETEIVGQMHAAVQLSSELGLSGPRTEWVFEEAWKIARKVRRLTSLGAGKLSLARIALEHVHARLAGAQAAVGLVGVSDMTERCARHLAAEGTRVVIFNRDRARAEVLAHEVGGTARSLRELGEGTDVLDAVILATGAPETVLRRADLEMLAGRAPADRPPLLIDLANPPDVDPEDARSVGLPHVSLEDVLQEAEEHRSLRLEHAADARAIIDQALIDLHRRMIDAALGPMFAVLQERYRSTALEGVERLFSRHLQELDDEQREAVRRWAQTLARRMAHLPTAGLRAVAKQSGFRTVEAFLEAADKELAREMKSLARSEERPAPSANSPATAAAEDLS